MNHQKHRSKSPGKFLAPYGLCLYAHSLCLLFCAYLSSSPASSLVAGQYDERFKSTIDLHSDCNEASEFLCKADNICIPLEWRCDFSEQCSDGQDEIGCTPEWCDFRRDMCNLDNDDRRSSDQTKIFTWRRYSFPTGEHRPMALGSKRRILENRRPDLLIETLDKLGAKINRGSKVAFVPLILETRQPGHGEMEPEYSSKIATRARSALLQTPLISNTNSMCQLRFRYAVWMNQAGSETEKQISLELVSRRKSEAKVLWTSPPPLPATSSRVEISNDTTFDANFRFLNKDNDGWQTAIVDLGHVNQFSLAFLADLNDKSESFSATKQPAKLVQPGLSEANSADLGADSQIIAFVALQWLSFQGCAWPLGNHVNLAFQLFGQPKLDSVLTESGLLYKSLDQPAKATTTTTTSTSTAAVSWREFKCSNEICVDEQRLCNFVDDCMAYEDGDQAPEDESSDLCGRVLGMENFEGRQGPERPDDEWTSSFWLVRGNWPSEKRGVVSNSRRLSHLPKADHTSRSSSGHFYSLQSPHINQLDDESTHFWFTFRSMWLERLEAEAGECRIKFFYNLVEESSDIQSMEYKIDLNVEFITINQSQTCHGKSMQLTRSVVARHTSHLDKSLANTQNAPDQIDYAGHDFWREINLNLGNLDEEDVFYIRVTVSAEPLVLSDKAGKFSFNIDDLSTHFGCGLAKFGSEHLGEDDESVFFKKKPKEANPPVMRTYSRRPRLHKRDTSDADQADLEPPKLVAGVLAILFSIVGAILFIVFLVVPYVERASIKYHDELSVGLADVAGSGNDSNSNSKYICELTAESDWERLSRQRWSRPSNSERAMTNSSTTNVDSLFNSNRNSSVNLSDVVDESRDDQVVDATSEQQSSTPSLSSSRKLFRVARDDDDESGLSPATIQPPINDADTSTNN